MSEKRCAWMYDSRLPIGFNSREDLKEFTERFDSKHLEGSLKELKEKKEIAEWRIELIEEILEERRTEK